MVVHAGNRGGVGGKRKKKGFPKQVGSFSTGSG